MNQSDFNEVLAPSLPKAMSDPYYFAFMAMVTAISGHYRHSKESKETVDFVFDKQQGKEGRTRRLYSSFSRVVPHWNLGPVKYGTEQEFIQLQAADLIAWQNRRFLCTDAPIREELARLHADRSRWFRKIVGKIQLGRMVRAVTETLPKLREEFGDDLVDQQLEAIRRRPVTKKSLR